MDKDLEQKITDFLTIISIMIFFMGLVGVVLAGIIICR
jgi:hypothetical protein